MGARIAGVMGVSGRVRGGTMIRWRSLGASHVNDQRLRQDQVGEIGIPDLGHHAFIGQHASLTVVGSINGAIALLIPR